MLRVIGIINVEIGLIAMANNHKKV